MRDADYQVFTPREIKAINARTRAEKPRQSSSVRNNGEARMGSFDPNFDPLKNNFYLEGHFNRNK